MIQGEADFVSWLDNQLSEFIPSDIQAFCINIYESPFCIEVIGSSEYTSDDEDWVCNENWIPNCRVVAIKSSLFGESWVSAQSQVVNWSKSYFSSEAQNVIILKQAKAFAVGFVDGDLEYISGN
ncbi:hypothetical protein SOPP22_16710 [Shewanella sp. OPT22]|nr:hypothetical protein SOPP22_16710 [Shewanella sp. OPT22]